MDILVMSPHHPLPPPLPSPAMYAARTSLLCLIQIALKARLNLTILLSWTVHDVGILAALHAYALLLRVRPLRLLLRLIPISCRASKPN